MRKAARKGGGGRIEATAPGMELPCCKSDFPGKKKTKYRERYFVFRRSGFFGAAVSILSL
jgi:hypothetical protein